MPRPEMSAGARVRLRAAGGTLHRVSPRRLGPRRTPLPVRMRGGGGNMEVSSTREESKVMEDWMGGGKRWRIYLTDEEFR